MAGHLDPMWRASRDVCGRERPLVARTRDRPAAIHGLLAAGHSERAAARILGLARGTVHRFAAAATAGQLLVQASTRPGQCPPDWQALVVGEGLA